MSDLTATLHTSEGDVEIELYPEKAPTTVENFVNLAEHDPAADAEPAPDTVTWEDPETGETRGDALYDDVPIHRIIDDFMIQTGDPTGTGRGGPGYQFDDEFHEDLRHDGPGAVSMANSGPNTNGSQFFVTLDAQPHLDDSHAVFGRVTEGMDVVEAIGSVDTDANDRPREDVLLESVTVHQ
jgi:cyclophilin family peptidyl-prolyl cis-trans isomerase